MSILSSLGAASLAAWHLLCCRSYPGSALRKKRASKRCRPPSLSSRPENTSSGSIIDVAQYSPFENLSLASQGSQPAKQPSASNTAQTADLRLLYGAEQAAGPYSVPHLTCHISLAYACLLRPQAAHQNHPVALLLVCPFPHAPSSLFAASVRQEGGGGGLSTLSPASYRLDTTAISMTSCSCYMNWTS